MKAKYIFTFVIFFSLLFLTNVQAVYSFQNEPEGFRGIKWETKSKDVQGLKLIKEKETGKGHELNIYKREGEALSFGQAELKKVRYVFYQDHFFLVHLVAFSHKNYKLLKKELKGRFGEPSDSSAKRDLACWQGKQASIYLKYDVLPKRSVVSFYYRPIGKNFQSGR